MSVGQESIAHLRMQPSLPILFIMMIDANMNRCKLRLIIPLWECLIQICQPIVLALESRGVYLKKKRNRRKQAGFVVECSVRVLYNFRNLFPSI